MGSWFWKQEQELHDITWAFEAIMPLWQLSALLTVLGHLVVYRGCLRAKIRVSELEVRYTVPEVKGGDRAVVIQTPFGKIVTDASHLRVGQEYSRGVRDIFKDPSYPRLFRAKGSLLSLVFRTDVCQRRNQFIETVELLIRVSPSHSYNAGRAGLGWASGWPQRNVHAASSDCVVFLLLARFGESFHAYTRFIRWVCSNSTVY